MLKRELHTFLTAMMFFTRIPCPKWVDHNPTILSKSAKYFSLIGVLIGAIGALVFLVSSYLFSKEISILFSMFATIYTTGAFHEDGFADVCDGFGGGWTKDKILTIMKDSTLGTYGVIGLILILGLKFSALNNMGISYLPLLIIAGHSTSRFIATTLIFTHPYVRDTNSKSKPAATKITRSMVFVSGFLGCVPLVFFFKWQVFFVLIPMYLSKMYLAKKFNKWIGGQTGDCAGAVQQLSEVVFYLSFIALWKFI